MTYSERPWEMAQALLTAVEDTYAAEGVPLPSLRFVSDSGLVAYDCELLAVSLQTLYGISSTNGPAIPQLEAINCLLWQGAQFLIELIRCAPEGIVTPAGPQPPTAVQTETSARVILADSMLLTKAVIDVYQDGLLGYGANLSFEEWRSVITQGGLVGGQLRLRVGLA